VNSHNDFTINDLIELLNILGVRAWRNGRDVLTPHTRIAAFDGCTWTQAAVYYASGAKTFMPWQIEELALFVCDIEGVGVPVTPPVRRRRVMVWLAWAVTVLLSLLGRGA
jgi:hypothetical protein